MRKYKGGATRDDLRNKLRYEGFLSPEVLQDYARYMHRHRKQKDGSMREPDNWKQGNGIPVPAYVDSLIRHTMDAWREYETKGTIRKSLLSAILFNTFGLLWAKRRGKWPTART